jgi:hypothetical protein
MKQLLFLTCSVILMFSLIGGSDCRMLQFSGRNWYVRQNSVLQQPGPNYFNDSSASVWVDANSYLHLKITL